MFNVQASQVTVQRCCTLKQLYDFCENPYLISNFSSADDSFIHDGYDTFMIQFHQITDDFIVEVLDLYITKLNFISTTILWLSGGCRGMPNPPPPPTPFQREESASCTKPARFVLAPPLRASDELGSGECTG